MFKEILIILLLCHSGMSQNETLSREERSDKISATKVVLAQGLAGLGQIAVNHLSGKKIILIFETFLIKNRLFFAN